MPSISITDAGRLRLESISFFLAGLLLSAAVVWRVWNWLRRDFRGLPPLTFGKACGLVVLWGLLFVVVLTMISGARELMTPGAWERDGLTYKLRGDATNDQTEDEPTVGDGTTKLLEVRRRKLEKLAGALIAFTVTHGAAYPTASEREAIPEELWRLPEPHQLKYVYLPGRTRDTEPALLAYEPTAFGDDCWALFTDGTIRLLAFDRIEQLRADKEQP